MTKQLRSKQRGISFMGLLFVGGFLAAAGVVAAQVLPTVLELQAIQRAVDKSAGGSTVAEVRNIFGKASDIDDIKSITSKDLEVTKEGEKVVVKYSYQREIHLVGPGWLTLKYAGRSK